METSDLLVVATLWKVVLKYALVECGGQFATVDGQSMMLLWYADNLDTPPQVKHWLQTILI